MIECRIAGIGPGAANQPQLQCVFERLFAIAFGQPCADVITLQLDRELWLVVFKIGGPVPAFAQFMQPADAQTCRDRLPGVGIEKRLYFAGFGFTQAAAQLPVFQVAVQGIIPELLLELIEGLAVTGLEGGFCLEKLLALCVVRICQGDLCKQ